MKEQVSFTQQVKEEIASKEYSEARQKAILSAFIKINGALRINNDGEAISFASENAKTVKFLYGYLNTIYGISPKISYVKNMRLKKNMRYEISLTNFAFDIASDLYIDFFEGKISKNIAYDDDTIGGYLSGAFLASGSVNSPLSSNYHLEIKVGTQNFAKWMSKMINKYHDGIFTSKITKRRSSYIVYLKKSDQISNFLILLGATSSCLYFENIRVDRDEQNNENRLDNIYDANLKKTINASKAQVEDIKYIDSHYGIENMKKQKDKLVAVYRLEHPSYSLSDIANLVSKDIDKPVTRSNIAHILRKLHEFAVKLGKND